MFLDLYNFLERQNGNRKIAFAHAPISWLHQHENQARHDRVMKDNELGLWGKAYTTERKMTWKGMPWMCRKSFYNEDLGGYGALSQHKISWGGGDMHIGIKPWLLGFENWAIPTSPAIHIGPFPKDARHLHRYRLFTHTGKGPIAIGFLISAYVLGGEAMMKREAKMVKDRFGLDAERVWQKAIDYGRDEKKWLDERRCCTFEELLQREPWNN